MAKFGQAFINQLTNPGYGQGLFNLGSAIGSAPAVAAAEQKQKQQESRLMNYISALSQKALPPEGMAAQRESLLQSGISLDKILAAENVGAQQRERGIAGLEARQENINAQAKEARRRQLEKNAVNKAMTLKRTDDAAALAGADEATLRSYLMQKPKEGSKAKGYKVEKDILIDGTKQSVVEFFDAEGTFLSRKVIGEVAPDRGEAKGRDDWSVTEGKAYTQSVSDQRAASEDSRKYSSLLQETIDIAGESGQVGGVLGMARDFVISDVAGLGDAISVHRSRLNEVRMQNAIALLPRGPASDRDVRLALDASVDPKNLSAEDRIAYIRGVAKIAAAEKEYMDGKLRWIEQTGDALAFGYERKVSLDGMDKQVEAFKTDNSSEVNVLEGELEKVKALAGSGKTEEAKELLNYIKSIDGIGYLALLEEREAEQQRYDKFLEQNNINFF